MTKTKDKKNYSHDMNEEQAPKRKRLLPEGWREYAILTCEPSVSKGGNEMFIIEIQDKETGYIDTIYPLAVKGKRWFLKQILTACEITAGQDGVYDWDIEDLLGKNIACLLEHEDNKYINREGTEVTTKQHRIVEAGKVADKISWDD